MAQDPRHAAARYYDLEPSLPDDLPFYRRLVPSDQASVLELGCGTGRVLVPLAAVCGSVHGLDSSRAMLSICEQKLAAAGIPRSRARVDLGDICDFSLGRRFDLIIAPYRALQNLEDDSQLEGLFRSVREHLAPGGTCVLNVFHPSGDPETLKRDWRGGHEEICWECPLGTDRLVHSIRKARIDPERLILYPQLIYRHYTGDSLQEETVLEIAMRCYYPEEFDRLIREHGFEITNRWGGYAGESYGVGPELVVQFTR